MMKYHYLFIFLTLFAGSLSAQTILVPEVESVSGVIIEDGTDLAYIIGRNRIFTADLSAAAPTAEPLLNVFEAADLLKVDSFLYVSRFTPGEIIRVNLNATIPSAEVLLNGLSYPDGLAFRDGILYFVSAVDNVLFKADLSAAEPVAEEVIATGGEFLSSLVFLGNQLLITDVTGDQILSVDVNSPAPTVSVLIPAGIIDGPNTALVHNDQLIISGIFDGNIYAFDTTDFTLMPQVVATGLIQPSGLGEWAGSVLVCELGNDQIVQLGMVSAITDSTFGPDVLVYPNPTSDFLRFANLDEQLEYRIFDGLGRQVISGKISSGAAIDLRQLKSGEYRLLAANGRAVNFVKY